MSLLNDNTNKGYNMYILRVINGHVYIIIIPVT